MIVCFESSKYPQFRGKSCVGVRTPGSEGLPPHAWSSAVCVVLCATLHARPMGFPFKFYHSRSRAAEGRATTRQSPQVGRHSELHAGVVEEERRCSQRRSPIRAHITLESGRMTSPSSISFSSSSIGVPQDCPVGLFRLLLGKTPALPVRWGRNLCPAPFCMSKFFVAILWALSGLTLVLLPCLMICLQLYTVSSWHLRQQLVP